MERWSINKQFGPGGAGCAAVATRSQVVTGKKGFVRLRTDFGLSSGEGRSIQMNIFLLWRKGSGPVKSQSQPIKNGSIMTGLFSNSTIIA